jgi:hypothetical protein
MGGGSATREGKKRQHGLVFLLEARKDGADLAFVKIKEEKTRVPYMLERLYK